MDTSRTPTSADDEQQQKTRMTSNHVPHANTFAYQENAYHQKPPSFIHKQVNISLVEDGAGNQTTKKQKAAKNEKQQSGEWRESIPIKLEHLLFNFKENSLKVYKASPPRIMQIISLIIALLLFCGVLALVLSQRDDHLKKEANLPLDQSAVAERIIGESQLLNNKLKNSLFDVQKNQTDKSRKYAKSSDASKDAAVRKAFGSLLFSGDDDEAEPDAEENSSDESFDGERSRSRNFNLFLDNERPSVDEKEKSANDQSENPRVMFIERLMGLHFGLQPKIGLSESLVIRKTIGQADENASVDDQVNKPESEIDLLLNRPSNHSPNQLSSKNKEARNEDPTPFLLRYAAAAMLSRVLAAAQQQAYIQQVQQQRFREMNEKTMYGQSPYRGYRMREPIEAASFMREEPMYGRPINHQKPHPHYPQSRPMLPFQAPNQFMSERGLSRGPLLSNEEAESQQIHPIILMLNLPYKDQQTPAASAAQLMFMGQGQSNNAFAHPAVQPIFMPYATTPSATPSPRQNPYYKPQPQATRDQQPIYSSPFAHHQHKTHHYYPQPQHGYYAPVASSHPPSHPYNMIQSVPVQNTNSNYRPSQRYNQRMTNTIEVPIEIHQVGPVSGPAQAQIIVQPQIETQAQPNENVDQDQSGENEHHMVVFYSDADNINHPEENPTNGQTIDNNSANNQPNQPVFVKESKQINNDLEKANHQISKMLLLHFVNPNNNQPSTGSAAPPEVPAVEQQRPFLIQQEQPTIENKQVNSNKLEEMVGVPKMIVQNKAPVKELKTEDETSKSSNDQMNREEMFEKSETNPNESDAEPTSLAHFAQVIRHVIDQQQQNNQEQQAPTMQPILSQQQAPKQSAIDQTNQNNQNSFQPVQIRKEVENSNKETEKAQETIQTPAFMLVSDEEN